MDTRLPSDVAQFFTEYLQRLQAVLPNRVYGCYLYGSLTLGAYDPVKSDLDFMVVVTRPFDDGELEILAEFQEGLCRDFPLASRMEGQYVPVADIRCGERSGCYPSVAEGQYQGLQGVMMLYWYQLQTCGVCVAGPEPAGFCPPVEWELVQQEMKTNINGYWFERTQRHLRTFLPDESVEFTVLTLCRILYTLEHREIIPKVEAGDWALQTLPSTWRLLIEEGIRIRTGSSRQSLYPSRWQRAHKVRGFILAMREDCNRGYFG